MMRTTRIYFIVMSAMVTIMMMIRTKRRRRVLTQRKAEWQWTRFIGFDQKSKLKRVRICVHKNTAERL